MLKRKCCIWWLIAAMELTFSVCYLISGNFVVSGLHACIAAYAVFVIHLLARLGKEQEWTTFWQDKYWNETALTNTLAWQRDELRAILYRHGITVELRDGTVVETRKPDTIHFDAGDKMMEYGLM